MTAGKAPARDFLGRIRSAAVHLLPRRALAEVRRRRMERRYARFPSRVVTRDYAGEPLRLRIADPVGEAWYDCDWTEPPEVALLRQGRLRPGATVFDLGAHQGVVALLLARVVGPDGCVVAVEASGHEVEIARENLALNGDPRVELVHAAVAARPGVIQFGLDGEVARPGGEWPTVELEAVTVDLLAERHGAPDVLFIDVEGFEREALQGARDVLASRPDAFVEVHGAEALGRFGASVADVLEYFPAADYEVYAGSPGRAFEPLERSSPPQERFFLVALARGPVTGS